ncbi:MAG: CBS domain-containing protein [bacterium]|nr:CBS domain-containing protein [bacterium]
MTVNIAESLAATPVSELDLSPFVEVEPTASVAETVEAMNGANRSVACVVSAGRLLGIFTQRDILNRVIGRPRVWDHPIAEEMTRAIRTMDPDSSAADGLAIMNDWWVRSVPVVDGSGHLVGNLSYYTLMSRIAALITDHLNDDDHDPEGRHGLTLIDFTGLHTSPPVTVTAGDTVEVAAHHMKARAIGSVLVVDGHEHLVGMLTEYDLQKKIGCYVDDLSKIVVSDVMTPEPLAMAARSPIAEAVEKMAERGFSHLPLLGESGRPAAVASFRDIAAYMEVSFAAMG